MPPEPVHILVAVEDQQLRQTLVDSLSAAGFHLEQVAAAEQALHYVGGHPCDAVLLGLGGRDNGGMAVCRALRGRFQDLGIVMVRIDGTNENEIEALDAGADDCISAPFRFREIVARLGAVLRRVWVKTEPQSAVLRAGDIELDVERRRFRRASSEVHLSPREFKLLLALMQNPEVTLTHFKLLRAVWGNDTVYGSGYLRSYIKTLRRKIESDPAKPEYILTEPWVGYRFHDPSGSV
jgi:two-component system, OmpR family, KDP operon response regulator KdpE